MFVTFENIFIWWKQVVDECKVSCNRIVKGIEILIFEDFCIVYDYVKFIKGECYDTIITHKNRKVKRYLCKQEHTFP